ncbi:macrophage mannose receptor 1 [Aplysia californica]|uniref:Macrophage mannose receptor 1 n=1 Tax=Aplysia californica TaxID=6500 RepID=A0ABM0JDY4_APLCA|nr:macrophage mannose receptor 1 [Aplysia californica]
MTEAQTVCQKMGGQLPEAETLKHLAVLGRIAYPAQVIWMGATDHVKRNHYVWPSGEPVDRSMFGKNEPNGVDERCLVLFSTSRQLSDYPCERKVDDAFNIVCAIVLI